MTNMKTITYFNNKMKKYFIIILGLFFVCSAEFANASLYINANQKNAIDNRFGISFMGNTYFFGLGTETQNEYFLSNETPNAFSSLISLSVFKNNTDPLLVAENMYTKLLAFNQAAQLVIHRQSKEPMVTFVLKNNNGLELNLWRFYRNPDNSEVIGMQYLRTFKIPLNTADSERLKRLIQTIAEQFALLPKIDFIW